MVESFSFKWSVKMTDLFFMEPNETCWSTVFETKLATMRHNWKLGYTKKYDAYGEVVSIVPCVSWCDSNSKITEMNLRIWSKFFWDGAKRKEYSPAPKLTIKTVFDLTDLSHGVCYHKLKAFCPLNFVLVYLIICWILGNFDNQKWYFGGFGNVGNWAQVFRWDFATWNRFALWAETFQTNNWCSK